MGDTKGERMRTATDVISRLMWDESVQKEDFTVGYLDRFKGIVEKPFTSLDWSDPAIVDNYTLALPKHRIQYFAYKNKKVWDKNMRLDLVFGSSRAMGVSIHEFMKAVDEEEKKFNEEGFDEPEEGQETTENAQQSDETYDNSDRPNFFFASRISDDQILQNLNEITEHIKIVDSDLDECCIKDVEFHLTLVTTRLDSPQEISDAVEVLNDLKRKNLPAPTITLKSLDMFRHRVSYACVKHDSALITLRNALIELLTAKKIVIKDKFGFIPHVTIVKLSRPVCRMKHTKFLDQNLFESFANNEFGSQVLRKLSLCSVGSARREDGFFSSAAEIEL